MSTRTHYTSLSQLPATLKPEVLKAIQTASSDAYSISVYTYYRFEGDTLQLAVYFRKDSHPYYTPLATFVAN